MKLSSLLTLVFLIVIAILGYVYAHERDARLRAEAHVLAQADTLRQVTRTAAIQRAELVTEHDALAAVSADLRAVLKKTEVQSVSRITLTARPESTLTVRPATVRVDTVWQSDVRAADMMVSFDELVGRYRVLGWTHTIPPGVWLKVEQRPLTLTVIATELRRHQFAFAADTGDTTLAVTAIDGKVVLRRPGWWTRRKFLVGLVIGGIAGTVLR